MGKPSVVPFSPRRDVLRLPTVRSNPLVLPGGEEELQQLPRNLRLDLI